jgi:quinol monooxygenase YgiN
LQDARKVHNSTAGAPQNVAAAQALGDLSHLVYVPTEKPAKGAGEFLIMDIWNSMDGLNQFFANPTVQEQAGQIFTQRDPVVWTRAEGFAGYHIPAPYGRNDRIVAIVRGKVESREKAMAVHNEIVKQSSTAAHRAGDLSHEAYFRMAAPNTPEALEFLAVDMWMDHQGMHDFYDKPEFMQALGNLFTGQPDASTWIHPAGDWVEW